MQSINGILLNAVVANGNSTIYDLTDDGFTEYAFHRSGTGDGTVTIYGTSDFKPTSATTNVWVSLGTVASGAIFKYSGALTGFYIALSAWSANPVTVKFVAARR